METLDWSKLPAELAWLAAPAEQYGSLQFDDAIYEYLHSLKPNEKSLLRELGTRWGKHYPAIDGWLNRFSMVDHPEARLVYFTGVLIGTALDAGQL